MTGAPGGRGGGSGRHRGRFAEHAKPPAAVLTGSAALLAAVAGTITLLRSGPGASPSTAVTTTVMAAPGTTGAPKAPDGGPSSGGPPGTTVSGTRPTSSPSPSAGTGPMSVSSPGPTPSRRPTSSVLVPTTPPSRPSRPPAAVDPQWQGTLQVDPIGISLATIPPSHDRSGTPDISSDTWNGTFAAGWGAAKWTSAAAPTPAACATLILAEGDEHVTAADGDSYCIRVGHSPVDPGNQYAVVTVLAQGRDASGFAYVRVEATVWPDAQ
ncbi:hypothetical protein [Catenulispora subtropica]|uniref:Serine/threonine protein kinase n=1 Tax=Catenulispora subtropica TaxID=450798 RepID=A0ABP5DG48_9ACTN